MNDEKWEQVDSIKMPGATQISELMDQFMNLYSEYMKYEAAKIESMIELKKKIQ